MVYVIALSIILGALGIYYYVFKNLNHFKKHGIPYLKPVPLMGNMTSVILRRMSLYDFTKKIYNINSEAKYVGAYEFFIPSGIVLRDPELIKSVALKNFDIFPNHRTIVTEEQDPLFGKTLMSLLDDRWREERSMLSPSFTSNKLKTMFNLMSDCAVDFAKFVANMPPEQRIIDTKDILTRYTSDVIATCVFGISVDSMRDPNNLFYIYGKEATQINSGIFLKMMMFQFLPRLARIFNVRFIRKKFVDFFQDLVETIVKTRDEKDITRPDMLQQMMESRGKKDGKKELTIEDMTSHAFNFFLAGFEATATFMSFAAHEIAVNEDIRKRLQSDIDQVLEDTKGQAPYDAINNMEYLGAILDETLRMYCVVATDRVCKEDFELPPTLPGAKPYTVKKGQVVSIPICALHYDPKYFKQPEKFDPERFVGEQKKDILNTGAYLPFGLGPRMCIGFRFALLEMKVVLFHLLARCDLLPCEKTSIPMKLAKDTLAMKPEGGFWLKVVPRKNPHRTIVVTNMDAI